MADSVHTLKLSRRTVLKAVAAAAPTVAVAGTVFFNAADEAREGGRLYELQAATERLVVDPRQKGAPGDLVVVWPKKRGPVVTRRLARCRPYNTYYFRDLDTGDVFQLPCNKVSAIHAVVGA